MTSLSGLTVDELADGICLRAGRIAAAEAELLVWIGEFDARGGWAGVGMTSCAVWLSWRTGLSPVAARERVRVARALRERPFLAEAFGNGLMSWSKVRARTCASCSAPSTASAAAFPAAPGTGSCTRTTSSSGATAARPTCPISSSTSTSPLPTVRDSQLRMGGCYDAVGLGSKSPSRAAGVLDDIARYERRANGPADQARVFPGDEGQTDLQCGGAGGGGARGRRADDLLVKRARHNLGSHRVGRCDRSAVVAGCQSVADMAS